MIQATYYLPHPPIILSEIGRGEETLINETRESYFTVAKEIAAFAPQTIILASPHAPLYADGFFIAGAQRLKGDFGRFGFPKLGTVLRADLELSKAISRQANSAKILHLLDPNHNELDHGALVPLAFIEKEYHDFEFVHLGLSGLSAKEHYRLGLCIQKAVDELDRKAVFIASGDCSHVLTEDGPYGYKEAGPAFDAKLMELLSKADFEAILEISPDEAEEAAECGLRSCQIMAGVLEGMDSKGKLLSYEGPFGVGYGVVSFHVHDAEQIKNEENSSTESEELLGEQILTLAKESISYYLERGERLPLPNDLPSSLTERQAGCFVTLHKFGELRGCIGTMQAVYSSLAEEIVENAVAAAFRDPRFPEVDRSELLDLSFSVDVLGELERIPSTDLLDPQHYGVFVMSGRRSGVLLPRLEGVDTVEHQLGIALAKAGIAATETIELYRFEVIRYE